MCGAQTAHEWIVALTVNTPFLSLLSYLLSPLPPAGHRGVQLCDAAGRPHRPHRGGRALGRLHRRGGVLGAPCSFCTATRRTTGRDGARAVDRKRPERHTNTHEQWMGRCKRMIESHVFYLFIGNTRRMDGWTDGLTN